MKRAGHWAIRIMHEAQLYEQNCFITLTYDDEHLPEDGTLCVRDFQLFMKRLRKEFPDRRIRFFHCGEYGDQFGRPHYHACLFNIDFDDKKLIREENEHKHYDSPTLELVWGNGHVDITDLNHTTAAYCARYIMKKVNGKNQLEHYCIYDEKTGEIESYRIPEYTTMSRRPGIGQPWLDKYLTDVYPSDEVIVNGKQIPPPKYYDSMFEIINPEEMELIKKRRKAKAFKNAADNNKAGRLATKEKCKVLKLNRTRRNKL